jgi:soluble lytic murein transglycosylase
MFRQGSRELDGARLPLLLIALVVLPLCIGAGAQNPPNGVTRPPSGITPTNHPPLPARPSLYWLVPEPSIAATTAGKPADETASARLARSAALIESGDFAAGLALVQSANLTRSPLQFYGRYYAGVALQGLRRFDEADAALDSIDDHVNGYLEEAVPLRRAEIALARGDAEEAADLLDDLSDEKGLSAPEEVLLRLAAALEAAGDRDAAVKAYLRVYYEFPLSDQATDAQNGIERLQTPALIPADRFRQELNRAERLFSARRWAQARAGFALLASVATKDDAELVALRIAECDYYLNRHRASRDALRPYLRDGSKQVEARYFYLMATRGLGERVTYLSLARELVTEHPESNWAEETLNGLATSYITDDDEARADEVFRELLRRFPRGRYSERAGWKAGWWAYKQDRFSDAAAIFEAAAAAFPRSDYRPSWIYWAARSRDQRSERAAANALYRVVVADYQHSYYGRLASTLLVERREPPVGPIVGSESPTSPAGSPVPNDALIRALVSAEMYDAAVSEVEYARRAWGDSVPLQATLAFVRHRRGLEPGATERFADVRGAITIMRRAYPQFMAAGGEQLPPDILRVIFPLDYWPLIKKYSDAHRLDPYLMTALIAQESTFTADVRSSANAVGLMQLIPSTGRTYARKVGVPYSARILTQPETNIRLGMRYFRDLMDRFGSEHYALASYNAGEHRIARWITERPGFEQDEFVDDIPFAETQNYVKRILGTADDYRRLYGGGVPSTTPPRR